jgi:lipid-A-disaccharide synthase
LLVSALKQQLPGVEIDAVGGSLMGRAGANIVESSADLAVVGLFEGVGAIPAHARLLARLRRRFAEGLYDLVILVDYPGFHLRVAAAAASNGVPVLYYIAPQLWAWGAWRIKSIRRHIKQMAVVIPFEEEYFRSRGVLAEFVGHPLLDSRAIPSPEHARTALELPDGVPTLGLLPGSRSSEVKRLWPSFRDAAKILLDSEPSLRVLVAAIDGIEYPGAPEFQYCHGDSVAVLAAADAVLCKSGTATLEAALQGTPMVIAYRVHPLTYAVAKLAVQVTHIGLVNVIAGREVCPELLQTAATPQALARAVTPLLDRKSIAVFDQLEAFAEIRDRLGGPGTTQRVAEIAVRMVA